MNDLTAQDIKTMLAEGENVNVETYSANQTYRYK